MASTARVLVEAQDLAAGVDPERHCFRGAWDVDGLVAPAVEEEPVNGKAGGVIAAHDLTALVDSVGRGLEDGVRVVDRGELAPVEEKTGAERVHGLVDDAAQGRRFLGRSRGCRPC